jgi:hypothetical protein
MSEDLDRKREAFGEAAKDTLAKLAHDIDALARETWRGDEIRKCDDYQVIKAKLQNFTDAVTRLRPSADGAIHFVRKVLLRPSTTASSVQELVQLHEDLLRLLVSRGYRVG